MPLDEAQAPREPLVLFRRWFREAQEAGVLQPDAMTLATSGDDGPSATHVPFG